jgi:hypothetical protein
MNHSTSFDALRARTPGRPKPASERRETRRSFAPSAPAQAGLEPRHSIPSGDRERYSASEGL